MKARFLALLIAITSTATLAQLDINQATQAELERLRGVGPQLSARILAARDYRPFTDWEDLRRRVAGLGPVHAARLSKEGLVVSGAAFAATDSMLTPLNPERQQTPTRAGRPEQPVRRAPQRSERPT
jgi:competence protein ComEA